MKSLALVISVFLNISLVVVLCVFAMRGSSTNLGAPVGIRSSSTVGIGRPMTRAARSYAPRVYAQPGKQPNFQDLPKMALGGMAAAKGIGLASVAHAADIQQVYR